MKVGSAECRGFCRVACHLKLRNTRFALRLMIPLNAFSTLNVQNIIDNGDAFVPQTFQRGVSRQGELCDVKEASWIRPGGFPQRPPSKLPPPRNEHLSVALGETIGTGRVGTVHELILLTHHTNLPPLVAKISRRKLSESMEKEAWFYEELEQVQGIAVLRCYGFFQTRVKEEEGEVWTWNDPSYDEPEYVDDWGRPVVKEEGEDSMLLSVLLLERLGFRIPLGFRGCDYSPISNDVYEIYDDLARLGIEHVDFRWSNILAALPDPVHGFSEPVCPNHGHAHLWRIIDLDLARKINYEVHYLDQTYSFHLGRLFKNAPEGIVVEPWE